MGTERQFGYCGSRAVSLRPVLLSFAEGSAPDGSGGKISRTEEKTDTDRATSGCGGCHLRALCGGTECEGSKPNAKALLWAYGVPFLLLIAGVVAAHVAGLGDGYAALTGIGAVALYYGFILKKVKI